MMGQDVRVPVVDFGQKSLTKRVVSGIFEAACLEIPLNHFEFQFPQPVLVFARVGHFFSIQKKRMPAIKQTLNTEMKIRQPTAVFPLASLPPFRLSRYPHEPSIP